jgi:hypothetical protein
MFYACKAYTLPIKLYPPYLKRQIKNHYKIKESHTKIVYVIPRYKFKISKDNSKPSPAKS